MSLPETADVPLILSRIRPDAAWGWSGGAPHDISQVVWRDLVQRLPTETEFLDEWTLIEDERANEDNTRQELRAAYDLLVGRPVSSLSSAEVQTLLEMVTFLLGGIDPLTHTLRSSTQEWPLADEVLEHDDRGLQLKFGEPAPAPSPVLSTIVRYMTLGLVKP